MCFHKSILLLGVLFPVSQKLSLVHSCHSYKSESLALYERKYPSRVGIKYLSNHVLGFMKLSWKLAKPVIGLMKLFWKLAGHMGDGDGWRTRQDAFKLKLCKVFDY